VANVTKFINSELVNTEIENIHVSKITQETDNVFAINSDYTIKFIAIIDID